MTKNSSDVLKGNFKVNKKIEIDDNKSKNANEEFKQKVLSTLGGSMVYMERKKLVWDGDKNSK